MLPGSGDRSQGNASTPQGLYFGDADWIRTSVSGVAARPIASLAPHHEKEERPVPRLEASCWPKPGLEVRIVLARHGKVNHFFTVG